MCADSISSHECFDDADVGQEKLGIYTFIYLQMYRAMEAGGVGGRIDASS